jgi:phospholipid transport system substrate-binding protein
MPKLIPYSRRTGKIVGLSLALSLIVGIFAGSTAALAVNPQDNVRGFYDTLLMTMRNGPTLGQSGRYARLAPVVDRVFDVSAMTRLAIGPTWATLPPARQQQLIDAFRHFVAATYADRFDSYLGQQLQGTGERPHNADVIVQTKIVKSDGDTTTLDYLDASESGLVANFRRLSRRHDQPAGYTTLGVPLDPPARGGRRSGNGVEPQG